MAAKKTFAWQDKVGNSSQVGGIETSVLDNGPGKGTRIAWVNTGAGLRYKVVVDRGLDLADAFYFVADNQHIDILLKVVIDAVPYIDVGDQDLVGFFLLLCQGIRHNKCKSQGCDCKHGE